MNNHKLNLIFKGATASSFHINSNPTNTTTTPNSQNIACSAPLSNLITMQPVTTVERCPTCNQLKTLNISNANPTVLPSTTSPGSYLSMGSKQQQAVPPVYNPLTASSSLSSSTSSINSSNKQIQQQPINIPMQTDKK